MVPSAGANKDSQPVVPTENVLADAGLADIDAELEEFAMNAGCTPGGIFPAHLPDQIPNFTRNNRASGLGALHFPCPEQAKALAMPGHDSFRLHDDQAWAPIAPEA